MVQVYLLGFPNATQLEDLPQSFTVLWVFGSSQRNCWGPAVQRVWSGGRTAIAMHRPRGFPKVLGYQEHPASLTLGFS